MARPDGLLEATMYADRLGVPVENVIAKIKNGTYIGRQVHGEWYLEPPEVTVSTNNTTSQDVTTQSNESRHHDDVPTSYGMARVLLKLSSFLGWMMVFGGLLWLLSGYVMSDDGAQDKLIKGGIALLVGFAIVHINQVILAVLDTADNTLELLRVMRNK
ncbi:hypothetical protein LCGC14_0741280 [marine sediment metagenome]|uniref:Uncharacterized protein n=1 Tax=marine sediment metagenome TaxID=412755 RepID=A0A0F9QRM7_9ZZZZ|nr:hypothetical protein [Methylophaga sp.]HEC59930.1 hypothetical protein [Methylophaga sp.]